jgi:thiol:disulfide interchange protein
MERTVLRAPRVVELLDRMVKARLYTDGTGANVEANTKIQEERFKTVALPLYVILSPEGAEIARINQKVGEETFVAFLRKALPDK